MAKTKAELMLENQRLEAEIERLKLAKIQSLEELLGLRRERSDYYAGVEARFNQKLSQLHADNQALRISRDSYKDMWQGARASAEKYADFWRDQYHQWKMHAIQLMPPYRDYIKSTDGGQWEQREQEMKKILERVVAEAENASMKEGSPYVLQ